MCYATAAGPPAGPPAPCVSGLLTAGFEAAAQQLPKKSTSSCVSLWSSACTQGKTWQTEQHGSCCVLCVVHGHHHMRSCKKSVPREWGRASREKVSMALWHHYERYNQGAVCLNSLAAARALPGRTRTWRPGWAAAAKKPAHLGLLLDGHGQGILGAEARRAHLPPHVRPAGRDVAAWKREALHVVCRRTHTHIHTHKHMATARGRQHCESQLSCAWSSQQHRRAASGGACAPEQRACPMQRVPLPPPLKPSQRRAQAKWTPTCLPTPLRNPRCIAPIPTPNRESHPYPAPHPPTCTTTACAQDVQHLRGLVNGVVGELHHERRRGGRHISCAHYLPGLLGRGREV